MKVLMLGWEFPPFIAGGLGTACYGLTRAMNVLGVDVLFVLPRPVVAHAAVGLAANDGNNSHASTKPQPAMAMVGAQYSFPHARQAGSERVAESRGPQPAPPSSEALLHSPFVGGPGAGTSAATRMTYLDYDVSAFEHVEIRALDAMLSPYLTAAEYRRQIALLEQRRAEEKTQARAQQNAAAAPQEAEQAMEPAAAQSAEAVVLKEVHVPAPEPGCRPAEAAASPVVTDMPIMPVSMLSPPASSYSANLMEETRRYAGLVAGIARDETFDVIHAHDWMTFCAGIAAKKASGQPLIVHVHSTEYDRNPHHPDTAVIAIETEGLQAADCVIAVSHMTRRLLVTRYGVDEEKIVVVHNAIDGDQLPGPATQAFPVRKDEKVVLFLGRMTAQKGPEYFLAAARKVLDVYEPVKFIMAGAGDLMKPTIELAAAMGIGHKVLFTGFLNARDVEKIYQMADLYVMPSVSEPFGIAPLEALSHDVPVIVSKQSGVSEILKHALKVDFWDIDALADRILAVLRHAPLASTLKKHAREEVRKLSWVDAAKRVREVYGELAEQVGEVTIDEVPVAKQVQMNK